MNYAQTDLFDAAESERRKEIGMILAERMSNPFKEFDTNIDGKEFRDDVCGIGDLWWCNDRQSWCGLINFNGMLATAEFKVTALEPKE